MTRFAAPLALALAVAAFAVAVHPVRGQPEGLSNWSFDELVLANGSRLQGLLKSELPDGYWFQSVSRLPGRPTVTLTSFFAKTEVARVNRLTEADRAVLKERLAELDPNGEAERKRMGSLELVACDWPGRPGGAKRYDSEFFALVSTGSEDMTRRSAARLEQVYAAFTRFLPPAVKDPRPTRVMLATDPAEYKALLGPLGGAGLLNPAVYDRRTNRVLCGHDLRRLGDELQTAQTHHGQQLAALDRADDTLKRLYTGAELDRFRAGVRAERKRVWAADAANGARFDQATARVFAVLYHEAFHAYAGTFVYPPLTPDEVKAGKGAGELPRWLNEGLAQVFETAVVEAGELRADTPDTDRLARAKDWLKGKPGAAGLVPLGDLLATGKDAFLAAHADQKAAADRAYLSSWALAFYLTFDRRLVGTPEFRKYLVAVNAGGDPRQAFAALVGKELPAFEKDWHAYLLRLQPDGRLK